MYGKPKHAGRFTALAGGTMNIRFSAESIRVRITREEADRLIVTRRLQEAYRSIGLVLEILSTQDPSMSVMHFEPLHLQLKVPEVLLKDLNFRRSLCSFDSETEVAFEIDIFKQDKRKVQQLN